MKKKLKKIIPFVIAIIVIVGILFIPPKDFRISNGKLVTYEGGSKIVTVPRSVKKIGSKSFDSTIVETIIIPGRVKEIEEGAFAYSKITTFVMKEGIEKIDENAFRNTSAKDFYFPSSIKTKINLDNQENKNTIYIHLVKDSYLDKYFKKNPPKAKYKIKYDYKEEVRKYD